MTKQGLLQILIHQAQANGFNFNQWFQTRIDPSAKTSSEALKILASGQRYYALLFSHDFASCFWKGGEKMSFIIPSSFYTKHDRDGHVVTVRRKAYVRRMTKANAWIYHLREMAAQEDPLRYIRRFLIIEEDLKDANSAGSSDGGIKNPEAESKKHLNGHVNSSLLVQ